MVRRFIFYTRLSIHWILMNFWLLYVNFYQMVYKFLFYYIRRYSHLCYILLQNRHLYKSYYNLRWKYAFNLENHENIEHRRSADSQSEVESTTGPWRWKASAKSRIRVTIRAGRCCWDPRQSGIFLMRPNNDRWCERCRNDAQQWTTVQRAPRRNAGAYRGSCPRHGYVPSMKESKRNNCISGPGGHCSTAAHARLYLTVLTRLPPRAEAALEPAVPRARKNLAPRAIRVPFMRRPCALPTRVELLHVWDFYSREYICMQDDTDVKGIFLRPQIHYPDIVFILIFI